MGVMYLLGSVLLGGVLGISTAESPAPPAIELSGAPEPEPETEPEPEPEPERSYETFIEQPSAGPHGGSRHQQRRAERLPPVYGPLLISPGLGFGPNSFGVHVGLTNFVVPWVGLGVDVGDTIVFDSGAFNDFAIGAHVWILPMPYFRVTPYIRGALGGEFFSHKLGAYGRWEAGGGLIIRLGKTQRIALRFGVEVVSRLPDARFEQNFLCGPVKTPCSMWILPELGVAFRFGQRQTSE